MGQQAEKKNGIQTYYFMTFVIFLSLAIYSLSFAGQFKTTHCLKNDVSAKATQDAFAKFVKQMKAADFDAANLPCTASYYDDTAFAIAREAVANETAASSSSSTDSSTSGDSSTTRRLLVNNEEKFLQKNIVSAKNSKNLENLSIFDKFISILKSKPHGSRQLQTTDTTTTQSTADKLTAQLTEVTAYDALVHSQLQELWCKTIEMNKGDFTFSNTNLVEGSSQVSNAIGMAIFYITLSILSFFIGVGIVIFSQYLPTEIPKMNIIVRIFGGCIRFFMKINVYLHYVILIQIIILWMGSLSRTCEYDSDFSILKEGGELQIDQNAGKAASQLHQVTGIMWILMHVFGGIIRSLVYIEPIWLDPDDPDENEVCVILFQKCGP